LGSGGKIILLLANNSVNKPKILMGPIKEPQINKPIKRILGFNAQGPSFLCPKPLKSPPDPIKFFPGP